MSPESWKRTAYLVMNSLLWSKTSEGQDFWEQAYNAAKDMNNRADYVGPPLAPNDLEGVRGDLQELFSLVGGTSSTSPLWSLAYQRLKSKLALLSEPRPMSRPLSSPSSARPCAARTTRLLLTKP